MNTTLRNLVEHRSPTSEDRRGYAVLVTELDDVVPRRHPDLPNLYVGVTVERPEVKLDRIDAGAKPRRARNHVVRLREDLCAVNEKLTREGAADRKSALS